MFIYTGYIYLWYDTKAKLFYLGGHKGLKGVQNFSTKTRLKMSQSRKRLLGQENAGILFPRSLGRI